MDEAILDQFYVLIRRFRKVVYSIENSCIRSDHENIPAVLYGKAEKPTEQLIHMYMFLVTNMDSAPKELIRLYCKRGSMENFIKESKNGFDFAVVSSDSKAVNANCLQIHVLEYNIFNWFKWLALPAKMRKRQIDTIRLKLLKIAAKAVHSADI